MPATPQRYPNGVTNVAPQSVFNRLTIPDPTELHVFYEDFDQYTAAQWVVGGVGAPVAPALVAGEGGILSVVNSAADNDNNWIQQAVTAWSIQVNKQLWFRARVQVSDATQTDIALGLQIVVAANNFLTPADGIFLRKDDDALGIKFVSRIGGVETATANFFNIASNTQFSAQFYYDGNGNFLAGINDVVLGRLTPATITAVALKVTAGVQNGDAVARTMLVDQILCVKER